MMSKVQPRLVVHEEIQYPESVPGLVAAMRVVRDAQGKLTIATGRVTEAKAALAAAEQQRDALTEAVVRGDVVGPAELRDAEAAIRDAEAYALLLAKGVAAAQQVVDTVKREMSSAIGAERARRIDAAAQRKLDAVAAWRQAHAVIEEMTRAEAEIRYVGVPQQEIDKHWGLLDHA